MKAPWWLDVSAPRLEGRDIGVDVEIRRIAQSFLLLREGFPMVRQFPWRDRPRALCVVLRAALMPQFHPFFVNFTKGGVA